MGRHKTFRRRQTCQETSEDRREIHNPGRLVLTTRRQPNLLRLSFICVNHKARRRSEEASERGSIQNLPASQNLSRNQRGPTRNPQPGSSCSNHTPTTKSSSAEFYLCKSQSQKEIGGGQRTRVDTKPSSVAKLVDQRGPTRNPQPGSSCSNHTPTTKSSSAEFYLCKSQSQKEIGGQRTRVDTKPSSVTKLVVEVVSR